MLPRKHLVIPDSQVTPETPNDHLRWIGKYIVEKQPDVIVHLGDFCDCQSLSSYDKGKLKAEGNRYKQDIMASNRAMQELVGPMEDYNETRRRFKEKQYKPEMHLTLGNHEHRITRYVEDNPNMSGFMSVDDLDYESFGWTVHPFLEIAEIDGVAYSHYFYNPLSGRPYGGESIETRLKNLGFSFVQGHQQMYKIGTRSLNNGRRIRGLIQGACYLHDEDYRGPQGNNEMRLLFMLHEVSDGDYMLMEISLDFLCRKYEGMRLWEFMEKNHPAMFRQSTWMKKQQQFDKAA